MDPISIRPKIAKNSKLYFLIKSILDLENFNATIIKNQNHNISLLKDTIVFDIPNPPYTNTVCNIKYNDIKIKNTFIYFIIKKY